MWAEILSKLTNNMSEFHLPHAHRAFRQHLDQRLTISVNDQAHVYPEILNKNCKTTSSLPPAQIIHDKSPYT